MPLRHLRAALLVAAAITLTAAPVLAQNPRDAAEMARLFDTLCLRDFPDDRALDIAAGKLGMRPMSTDQVKQFLHADPGRGWYHQTVLASYIVTIEAPPIRACAVRRMTTAGLSTDAPYMAAIAAFAARRRLGPLIPGPDQRLANDEMDVVAHPHAIAPAGAHGPSDVFILVTTTYKPQPPAGASTGRPGVEVRYVHQLPPPA